jgi:hypothetical protein
MATPENRSAYVTSRWSPVNYEEMCQFLGLLIYAGAVRKDPWDYMWDTRWFMHNPGLRSVMSQHRFMMILRFLHTIDNTTAIPRGQPGYDRCFKLRAVIGTLTQAWQAAYALERDISIDECMCAFKGRIHFLQYLPKKNHKWGLKAWVLCGSDTGFAYDWSLYTGKEDQVVQNLGLRVVTGLTRNLPVGHI